MTNSDACGIINMYIYTRVLAGEGELYVRALKRVSAAVLFGAALVLCGCQSSSHSAGSTGGAGTSRPEITQSSSSEAAFTVTHNAEPVSISADITYFGNRDISAAAELYTANNGGSVKIERAGANYLSELSERINADNSPDLCDKTDNTYPYLMSMNYYEDLTNYIDTTSPQWADINDIIELYSFKGGRYFYPTTVRIMPQLLLYVKSTYVQCGNIPDPEKLWLKGEWTWETFRQGARSVIESEESTATLLVSGANVFDNFLATTGASLFPRTGSRFANGFASDNASRVNELLSAYDVSYSRVYDVEGEMSRAVFLSGDEQTLAKLRKTDLAVGAVPYPRYDGSDEYFCKAVTEGYLVPKGAKNIQSAASFINYSRVAAISPEQRLRERKALIDSGLLRSDVEWLENLRGAVGAKPVIVGGDCFDSETNAAVRRILDSGGSITWNETVAENSPAIDKAIEKINAITE